MTHQSSEPAQPASEDRTASYLLSHNQTERERLDKQQETVSIIFDYKVVHPPVNFAGAKILDIGTGSGAWPLDIYKKYPDALKAEFTCIDISSNMFPSNPPPNMTFTILSLLNLPSDWTDKYTLVHQRLLLSSIKYDQWPLVINDLHRIVSPNGWVQVCETDVYTKSNGPCNKKVNELIRALAKHWDLDYECIHRIPSLLENAGFANVHVEKRGVKIGEWGNELGKTILEDRMKVWRGVKGHILSAGGFGIVNSEEELDALFDELEEEWEKSTDAEIYWYTFTAQKI